MQSRSYLDGSIYHMAHFNTLKSILRTGWLLSKKIVLTKRLVYYSIADENIQGLRDRIYIQDIRAAKWRSLHSYVPFYFIERTPMLYRRYRDGIQDEIFFLELKRSIVDESGVVFTDGNASMQLLTKFGEERVYISPINKMNALCERQYIPGGPYRSDNVPSNVYCGSAYLAMLHWAMMQDHNWGRDSEKIRVKHAEVLVPDMVKIDRITGIYTRTDEKARLVNMLIRQYGLVKRIPSAISQPGMYF